MCNVDCLPQLFDRLELLQRILELRGIQRVEFFGEGVEEDTQEVGARLHEGTS
jgi:hypothetical protein